MAAHSILFTGKSWTNRLRTKKKRSFFPQGSGVREGGAAGLVRCQGTKKKKAGRNLSRVIAS